MSQIINIMIYDWREEERNNKTLILGFGNKENNDSIVIRINNFMNHVYIKMTDIRKIYNYSQISTQKFIEKTNSILCGNGIIKYKTVTKKLLRNTLEGEKKFICLYFNENNTTRHFCNLMRKNGIKTYENDIPTLNKFLSSINTSNTGWIECTCEKVPEQMKITKINEEYFSSYTKIKPICKNYVPNPLVLSMDIEVYSSNEKAMPDSSNASDKIFMISIVSQRHMEPNSIKKYILYDINTDCNITIENVECRKLPSEQKLINAYFDLVNEIDPDIIIGYNIFSFDFNYMNTRLKRRLHNINNSSRLIEGKTNVIKIDWQSSAYGFNNYVIFDCVGRCPIDIFQYIKKEYKLQKYSLSAVSKTFINDTKDDLPAKEIFNLYKKGDNESIKTIAKYCIKDSVLTIQLFNKMNIWLGMLELSNVMRTCIRDLYTRGQQIRVLNQLYNECYTTSTILNKTENINNSFEYKGAIVTEPTPGIYKWCIALDFSSLYPSIIISHNICYSTFIDEKYHHQYKDEQCHTIQIENKKHKFLKNPKGIVPNLLEKMINNRKEIKRQLKEEKDNLMKTILDKRQWAYKISANSVYGSYGTKNSPYLQLIEGAECTTAIGRQYITNATKLIEEEYFTIKVYGDTDSCIFTCPILKNNNDCKKFGIKISKEISARFPDPVNLEFEEVYEVFLLITKKRYAAMSGKTPEKKITYKGIVVSRRDSCAFLREIYSEILRMIMTETPKILIENYLKSKLLDLLKGNIEIEKLIIRRNINKNYSSPNNPQLIYSNRLEKMGITTNPGDRVEFIFIKNDNPLQGYKMYPPEIVITQKMQIDFTYYINNHIKNPIDQLLEIAGMKKIVSQFSEVLETLEIIKKTNNNLNIDF